MCFGKIALPLFIFFVLIKMIKYSIIIFFSPNHHLHFTKDVISRFVVSGGLDKCSHKHVTQEQLQAAFHTPGVWYILTVQSLNLENLYPAYHNPTIVEGQCVLARWHFVGLLPGPDIVQWMSLVNSTLAPGESWQEGPVGQVCFYLLLKSYLEGSSYGLVMRW